MTETIDFGQEIDFSPAITNWANTWTILPILDGMSAPDIQWIHRLNSLGSLFYFGKITLRKHRLTSHLHKSICDSLEKDSLKEVLEIPRDHFKSTICSEMAPMWWALPFTNVDEAYMRSLGYGDEWIRWMHHAHNQDTRTLLVSANIKNAAKLGRRIDFHYTNNDLFRRLFPEITPTKAEPWAVESMTHRRSGTASAAQGEGTYDFLGVGAALQSRHYDRIIQDDLVGLDALGSEIVMQSVIDYHKLLVGAYDSVSERADLVGDEIVVGNRWQYEDLNSYLREFETEFHFTTHSAIGGCCPQHPYGKPIFPEEFSTTKLERIRQRLGTYFYSCQYLNQPVPPGESKFKEADLRWFDYQRFACGIDKSGKPLNKVNIVHAKRQNEVIKDVLPSTLYRKIVIDPNHSGKSGRSRHAVLVFGFMNTPVRMYLLDCWAAAAEYSELIQTVYRFAEKWKISGRDIHAEKVGFQKFLQYHFTIQDKLNKSAGKYQLGQIELLDVDNSQDAKTKRIEGMEPVYTRGEFFTCTTGCEAFLEEFRKYPNSKFKDVLDTTGHALSLWKPGKRNREEVRNFLTQRRDYFAGQSRSVTGY